MIIKKYSKNILSSKIDYEWKIEIEKKFRILTKNIDELTNILHDITNIEKKNDFKNCNSIITIKNHDEIINILKRYFENNVSKKNYFRFKKKYLTTTITFVSIE